MEINQMRKIFIESAVSIVARQGLHKATTKAISTMTGLNEAYIYRCFRNKEDLLHAAFHHEDLNFLWNAMSMAPVFELRDIPWKQRCFLFWQTCWNFVLAKPDDCIFYLRYYHSGQCMENAYAEHMEFFHDAIDRIRGYFKPTVDADLVMHQAFDTLLSFASRVMNREMPNDQENMNWAFEQVYSFIWPNIRTEIIDGLG